MPQNLGEYLSLDEVSLSQGELYTFLTNKNGRGKKGTLVACIKGTLSKEIITVLEKLPLELRSKVKEVTLDMAKNMEVAAKKMFPNSSLTTDRFHVIRLAQEALQHIRINLRWKEIEFENIAIKEAKSKKEKYQAVVFENDDTPKQLLARSRYILSKKQSEWTSTQCERAVILFRQYPELEQAYKHTLEFRNIYNQPSKIIAQQRFEQWILETHVQKKVDFYTVANTVELNMENILNFFNYRNTNANAESFNSKIKLFRANQRGVVDTRFFLFRLMKLFA